MLPPQELIRAKREGMALSDAQVKAFVQGLVDGSFADAQVGAMAMAILLKGMSHAETVALTQAMTHSGRVLDWRNGPWREAVGTRPVIDKHSTGGVGDKVSLMLAPLLAACRVAAWATPAARSTSSRAFPASGSTSTWPPTAAWPASAASS